MQAKSANDGGIEQAEIASKSFIEGVQEIFADEETSELDSESMPESEEGAYDQFYQASQLHLISCSHASCPVINSGCRSHLALW